MSNGIRAAKEYEIAPAQAEAVRLNGRSDPAEFAEAATLLAGRFNIVRPVSRTARFRRLLAHDQELDCLVSLDVLDETVAGNPEQVELFYQEARVAARLHHRNIPAMMEAEQHDGLHFRVCEHREGEPLSELLERTGWLSVPRALLIAGQIAQAIEYAHKHSVLHLSLQPESVLLDADGQVLVSDFGIEDAEDLAWAHRERISSCRAPYRSPQTNDGETGKAADWYALGVLLYEMLTDRVPFDSEDAEYIRRKQLLTRPLNPHVILPEVPEAVARLVMELLDKDPVERMGRVADFQARLKDLNAATTVPRAVPEPVHSVNENSAASVSARQAAPVAVPSANQQSEPDPTGKESEDQSHFRCEVLPIYPERAEKGAEAAEAVPAPAVSGSHPAPVPESYRHLGAVSEPEPLTFMQALRERMPEVMMLIATGIVVLLLIVLPRSGEMVRNLRSVLNDWLMKLN
ncbi:MAG TPA: serine/threonine-protein kinase [Blastocatellia bacterium]|nr:serine/threonine-protein kinase [Blastocatellia bacterium]